MPAFSIGARRIGDDAPTYFIADIAANHDGDLGRAKELIRLARGSGADAAKFQHFRAQTIVSDVGFRSLGRQVAHQAAWRTSVIEVYRAASVPADWTKDLSEACAQVGVDFFSAPYDLDAIEMLAPFVDVYKVGSGDITWTESLERIAQQRKPVILSTGASDIADVQRAVEVIRRIEPRIALLQCNTNYSGDRENFGHVHLNVLKTYRVLYPDLVLGLSDHTPGHSTVLGAVAIGARVIEKHFTDDTSRIGPDHSFSMDPGSFREMVDRTRELELALGATQKVVAGNEQETVIIQRRCLRAALDLAQGTRLTRDMLEVLRPAPPDGIPPYEIHRVIGMRTRSAIARGEHLRWTLLDEG